MQRFEWTEGASNKFWEIDAAGVELTVRFGRVGTAGQSKTKVFGDAPAALKERDKLIREKTAKGYVAVDAATADDGSPQEAPAAAVTHQSGLVVGARSLPGNLYDVHTLATQLEQTNTLLEDIGVEPHVVIADLGYRAASPDVAPVQLIHRGRYKTLTSVQRQ